MNRAIPDHILKHTNKYRILAEEHMRWNCSDWRTKGTRPSRFFHYCGNTWKIRKPELPLLSQALASREQVKELAFSFQGIMVYFLVLLIKKKTLFRTWAGRKQASSALYSKEQSTDNTLSCLIYRIGQMKRYSSLAAGERRFPRISKHPWGMLIPYPHLSTHSSSSSKELSQ